jgi:hypothetical protein
MIPWPSEPGSGSPRPKRASGITRCPHPVAFSGGRLSHDGREAASRSSRRGRWGPPGRKGTEALPEHIIVDMVARSLQGMTPEEAAKWATAPLRQIYGA